MIYKHCETYEEANELLAEAITVPDISEKMTQDAIPVAGRMLSTRTFLGRGFRMSSRVAEGFEVVPFRLGDYVPLEALNPAWQHNYNSNTSPFLDDVINSIFGGGTARSFNKYLLEQVQSPNLDGELRPIIEIDNDPSIRRVMPRMFGEYPGDEIEATVGFLHDYEKRAMEFYSRFGLLTVVRPRGAVDHETSFSNTRYMADHSPNPCIVFKNGYWAINGIGSMYDQFRVLRGCFFVPKELYIYLYGRANPGRRGTLDFYEGLDTFNSSNIFWVGDEEAKTVYEVHAERFGRFFFGERSPDITGLVVDDMLGWLTNDTLQLKSKLQDILS